MKRFFLFTLRLIVLGAIVYAAVTCGLFSSGGIPGNSRYDELEFRAEKALKYAQRKGLNENYCLFLDYGIPSGKPRLFVWSFNDGKVVYSGHAMHGPGRAAPTRLPSSAMSQAATAPPSAVLRSRGIGGGGTRPASI